MPIKQLADHQIDQIAAGEVVERPASVVKELVENAIDAGAGRIAIATAGGGKTLIRVSDDGAGIPRDELALAVRRHCTSKLEDGLDAIAHLGFRGEALPAIGSVATLTVTTRTGEADGAYAVTAAEGGIGSPRPAALSRGTVVEMRDLFQSVPARLKFLKTDRAENATITEVVRRIAIAFPGIAFEIDGPDRGRTVFEAVDPAEPMRRIAAVIGGEFGDNAIAVDAVREDVRLTGYAGLPTFNRGTARHQYFYVNGRPVRDKTLLSALRGAYADVMAKDRHPVAVLFLALDPGLVDVNVHPAKADVRFRDPGLVRGLLVGALKQAFAEAGLRPSTADAAGLVTRSRGTTPQTEATKAGGTAPAARSTRFPGFAPGGFSAPRQASYDPQGSPFRPLESDGGAASVLDRPQSAAHAAAETGAASEPPPSPTPDRASELSGEHPLGAAKAQFHGNFIVAETEDGIVIVDQHAAHERLVYERLKGALHGGERLAAQMLLIPEVVDLPVEDVDRLVAAAEALETLGLGLEAFGPGAVAVRHTPAILGEIDARRLVRDVADELAEGGTTGNLRERVDHVAATVACHGSVRAGRRLKPDEMNALLREMEVTPAAGQCNHGRPTFIKLGLRDVEAMFGRR